MNLKLAEIARCWWLTLVILATREAEIRRIKVLSQCGQMFARPYLEKTHCKNMAGGVAQKKTIG
jgi:hypothetical protein